MKHIYISIIAVIGLTLGSCSQEDNLITPSTRADSSEIAIEAIYTEAQQAIVRSMTNNILLMYGNKIAIPALPQDTPFGIQYAILTSKLPKNHLDELSKKYCTEQNIKYHETKLEDGLDYLLNCTSASVVAEFINFTHNYYSAGGHNLDHIYKACDGQPEIIQLCIVNAAAYIDLYTSNQVSEKDNNPYKVISGVEKYCLEQLISDMGNSAAADIVVGSILNGFGPGGALVDAGLSMYSTIELAYKFDMCIASH